MAGEFKNESPKDLQRQGSRESSDDSLEAAFIRALEARRDDFDAWRGLATLRLQSGRPAEAEVALRSAIVIQPDSGDIWGLLGVALLQQKRWPEAADAYRQAIARNPNDASIWSNLGVALWRLGELEPADEAYQRSLSISRADLPTMANYARLLLDREQPQQALEILNAVLTRDPSLVNAWIAAGDALLIAEEPRKAGAAFSKALELAPLDLNLRSRIAATLAKNDLPNDAEPLVQQIVSQQPESAESWALLALLRERQVRLPEADEALRRSLALKGNPHHHSNLLNLIQYACGMPPEALLQMHREWDETHAAPLLPNAPLTLPAATRDRPLRLGFVSAHFVRHPTSFLALSALKNLDRSQCTIVCYSDAEKEDSYTSRWRALSEQFRQTAFLSDEGLAKQISDDRVDFLFDLMGHNGKRMLVFARKPAPVQIAWIGYAGTTGMRAMDFLLADPFHVRPGEERFYSEAILRMPNDYACYTPPEDAPDVSPPPALSTGQITFGSFNNPAKYSPPTIDAWAEILKQVPGSRLLLKYRGLEQEPLQDRIKAEFAQRMIVPQRIILEGQSPPMELLQAYSRVDIGLDTQPYSGGLTTCEALWMGVPVITFPGQTFASRHSTSHLANAGLRQFVAADVRSYINLAVEWSKRLNELSTIRSEMRQQARRSPLCDAVRFADDFMAVIARSTK